MQKHRPMQLHHSQGHFCQTFTCGLVTMGSFAQQPSLPCNLALLPSSGTNSAAYNTLPLPSSLISGLIPVQIPALTESSSLEN